MPTNITAFDGLIVPQRNDRTNFASRGDLWMAAFQNFQTQANMQAGELNALANQVDADAAAAAAVASVISGALIDANTLATSTTSLSIPSTVPAARSFVLAQTGKLFSVGHPVVLVSAANPYNWMVGTLTAFAGESGAGTVNVMYAHGAGTYADWTVALCPLPMTTTNNAVVAKSATFQAKKADTGQVIEASGTWSLTYEACATLGNAWYHYVRTANGALITLDPNGSETVNGVTTLLLPPNALVLISTNGTSLTAEIVEQKPLATYTVSSPVAAINFLTIFESGAGFYDTFRIRVRNVSSSAADQLRMRVALGGVLNSGANWDSSLLYIEAGTVTGGGGTTGGTAYNVTSSNMLETTHMAAEIEFFSPTSSNFKHILSRSIFRTSTPSQKVETGGALWTGGAAITGFGLYWNSGANFDSGTIEIEGVRK